MKTFPLTLPTLAPRQTRTISRADHTRWTTRLGVVLAATAAVATLLILATWAAANGWGDDLGALSWMTAFVFLALSVDGSGRRAAWLALTGLALLLLGWLASRTAPEFGILAAWLVSAWAAQAIGARLRT